MILNANDRYSATNLPAVGERVVYATSNGTALKGSGWVRGVRRVLRGTTWVYVRLDGESEDRRLRPQSLYRAAVPSATISTTPTKERIEL